MDALNRLQLHIIEDDIQEQWNNFRKRVRSFFTRHQSRIGISLAETSHDSEGRVWVEVGNEGLRLRVTHLHPANPSVSEALKRKCAERREAQNRKDDGSSILKGKLIYPPEDDKISLSSLEDYWFNHWQGPFITADNNQNSYSLSRLRRSHRKSKRSNRCSICQKKLVQSEADENGEDQCIEREESIVAHMPSIKLDARVLKDDFEERSDDEISKTSATEDAVSRCSASDEQFSRMHRVVDNEFRTCFSLFADEVVSPNVIDGIVYNGSNEITDPSGVSRFFSPPLSPRQSRSCPCSPKLSARTYSPESISNSPKSRSSFVGISKFSLSSSLLAIHRQASNSLVPEFLKFDSGKVESLGTSKNNSEHNSLKSETRKLGYSLSDASQKDDGCLTKSKSDSQGISNDDSNDYSGSSPRSSVPESQSLPALKLSKMSLTYRAGVIISEENEGHSSESLEDVSEQGASALPFLQSFPDKIVEEIEKEAEVTVSEEMERERGSSQVLPDVVPLESICEDGNFVPRQFYSQAGFINLGFDGMEESSDFLDVKEEEDDNVKASSDASQVGAGPSIPDSSVLSRIIENENVKECSNERSEFSIHASECPNRGALGAQNLSQSHNPHQHEQLPNVPNPSKSLLDDLAEGGQYNTFIEKDVMQEARELVFWWRKKNLTAQESEFCLHETECKVKQKPLLLFLHGIGSSADVWNQQLWYFLSCGYEVVAPDLLGHGLSSAPRKKEYYYFSEMLDYISLVFDLFVPQGRKCIVVGHNYGCALAVALARGKPLSVGLVILASSGGPSPLVPHTKYENVLNSTVTRILNPFISCGCLSRELLYSPRGKHYSVVVSDDSGVPSTPRYVVEFTAQGQHWPEGDMAFHRRLTIPALLLYGMKDKCVSFVEMCEMERTIPRAFLELIPGAGHELMTDCPEEVCHAMHRFVRRWKQHF